VRLVVLAALLLAACETPPLTIRYRLTDGDSQQCFGDTGVATTECSDITMQCGAVLSIRIVPPDEPTESYVSICKAMSNVGPPKLCAIAGPDLPQPDKPIPERVLEVQLAVFPSDVVPTVDGELQCPIVQFGVNGLPVTDVNCSNAGSSACPARPAVGGRAFYHPGDEETLIELGCTELPLLKECTDISRTEVIATVNDFEFPGLDLATASHLFVSVGEPVPGSVSNYVLDSSSLHKLERVTASLPTWSADFVNLGLTTSYCIEVLEDAPMATRTLTCRSLPLDRTKIDALATRLRPDLLAQILKAANLTAFPSKGLVVGVVLSSTFSPIPNVAVVPSCATATPACKIRYLSEDKQSFTTTATGSSGIWISEDAPYGTTFTRTGQVLTPVFGGLVDNKVTIVVIQETGGIGGGQ
jgi:hypothetical protein